MEWRRTDTSQRIEGLDGHCNSCEHLMEPNPTPILVAYMHGVFDHAKGSRSGCNLLRSVQGFIAELKHQGFTHVVFKNDNELNKLKSLIIWFHAPCKQIAGMSALNNSESASRETLNGIIPYDPRGSQSRPQINDVDKNVRDDLLELFGIDIQKYTCSIDNWDHEKNETSEAWQRFDKFCDEIIVTHDLNLDVNRRYDDEPILNMKKRYSFVRSVWPNKTTYLWLRNQISGTHYSSLGLEGTSLYCHSRPETLGVYFEVIYNWAEDNNVPLILNTYGVAPFDHPFTWYKLKFLDDPPALLPSMDFSLFVRRSYNKTRVFAKWSNGMRPCLSWMSEVPKSGFGFDGAQIGTYFQLAHLDVNERKLTEITTLFLFAMTTYKMIQVDIANVEELYIVVDVLNDTQFIKSMDENMLGKRDIFLSIPMDVFVDMSNDTENNLVNKFNIAIYNIFINVAISKEADMLSSNFTEHLVQRVSLSGSVRIGIELSDCHDIVKKMGQLGQRTVKGSDIWDSQISSKRLDKWDHIVCNLPPAQSLLDTEEKMQGFLETHIYMKTIPQIFFPNLQNVYFKLLPGRSDQVKELLLLVGQMTAFAKGYNISYFLMPAFPSERDRNTSFWDISNYSDLSNVLVYQDIQSKYLGLETRRPKLARIDTESTSMRGSDPPSSVSEWSTFWPIFGMCIALVLLVATVALVILIVRARRNGNLLTDAEVREFMNGQSEVNMTGNETSEYNGHLVNTEYNSSHEISKADIDLDRENILGMGNFGVVYKGFIKSQSVAVKVPVSGCDKQTYIGMLREIKLLGYLGNHQNVVGFIGAYTKEIQTGTLYIVMELCSGGSLLSHLRSLKSGATNGQDDQDICHGLVRFTVQIASGMAYIASKNIIHGDIAARNILLDGFQICKVSDFGLSRKLYQYKTYAKKTQEPLPWRWMSFESLKNLEFSIMSDVWSFGVTVWEIFTLGDVPYPGLAWTCDFASDLEKGLRLSRPAYASCEIYEKMSACWSIDRDQRPNFQELFSFFARLQPYTEMVPMNDPHGQYSGVMKALATNTLSTNKI